MLAQTTSTTEIKVNSFLTRTRELSQSELAEFLITCLGAESVIAREGKQHGASPLYV